MSDTYRTLGLDGTPEIVAMVGPAGAGKSTWIARNLRGLPVVSLDVNRAVLSPYRCTCDQDPVVTAAAVELAVVAAAGLLRIGRSVAWDATNAEPAARALITLLAAEHDARSVAVVHLPPLDEVHARNGTRSSIRHVCGFGRRVPAELVTAMHAAITTCLPTLSATWDEVVLADQYPVTVREARSP